MAEIFQDFQNLPEDILMKIFEYLNAWDLRRFGSSCKRIHVLSKKSPAWTNLNVEDVSKFDTAFISFLCTVPDYITRLRIAAPDNSMYEINILDLSIVIYIRMPQLKELYLEKCRMHYFLGIDPHLVCFMLNNPMNKAYLTELLHRIFSKFNIISRPIFLPQSLRLISFRSVIMREKELLLKLIPLGELPNVEILELFSSFPCIVKKIPLLSSCSNLREFYLGNPVNDYGLNDISTNFHTLNTLVISDFHISSKVFSKLLGHLGSLVEFHVCNNEVRDEDIDFIDEHTFPNLKVLCIYKSGVTEVGIEKLFTVCKSLNTVYGNIINAHNLKIYGIYKRGLTANENLRFYNLEDVYIDHYYRHTQRINSIVLSHVQRYKWYCESKEVPTSRF